MKVFLCGSPRGEKLFSDQYKKLYTELEKLGYTNVNDDILKLTTDVFTEMMDKGGRDAYIDLYKRRMKGIQEADICIFEASVHSLGVGYLVERALANSKPTIVLYYTNHVPHLLSGVEHEKLLVKSYDDKNYKKILNEVLDSARERRDKRFNFFLSPKLLEYLEHASKKEGVTKSKLIRDLIVDHMRQEMKVDATE